MYLQDGLSHRDTQPKDGPNDPYDPYWPWAHLAFFGIFGFSLAMAIIALG